jgi:chromosome segregation ATPase
MDMQQLEIFTNLIKGLIVQNQDYAQQIVSLDNALEAVNSKVKVFENSEKEYFAKIKELENKYMDEIMTLKDNILNLKKENSEKSSKTIWETTQNKIKEKDEQIEELKRTIEFYKRTHNVLVGTTPEVKPEIKEVKPEIKEVKPEIKEVKPEIKEVKPEIKEVPKQKRKTKTTIKTSDINEDEIIIQPVVPPKPTKTTKNIKKPEIKESQIIQKTVIKEESECSEDELERRLMGL